MIKKTYEEEIAHRYACEVATRFSSVPDAEINRHNISKAAELAVLFGFDACMKEVVEPLKLELANALSIKVGRESNV